MNTATAYIDLHAIRHNFAQVQALSPASKIMAILKADAYGHGAIAVAQVLEAAQAFGVAQLAEGVSLRGAGIEQPVCLLQGVQTEGERRVAFEASLDLVVHAEHQLEILAHAPDCHRIWIKLDTGMGRLGFSPTEFKAVTQQLAKHRLLGVMTHLADAAEANSPQTEAQLNKVLNHNHLHAEPADAAFQISNFSNSAGIINCPQGPSDWIRPGIVLYGASPFLPPAPVEMFQPAMTFSAPVLAIKSIAAGASVGYGGIWTAEQDTQVAVLAVGYADGYPREITPDTPVLVGREQRPIVGHVSMDMLSVRLMPGDRVQVGDPVILWGPGLPIETIANCAGTIPYTLMTGLGSRVRREYQPLAN